MIFNSYVTLPEGKIDEFLILFVEMSKLPYFLVKTRRFPIPYYPGSTLPRATRCSFAALGATRGTVFLEFESNFPASMAINMAIDIGHGYDYQK